ncbi:MAG: hypothetical protein DSM106950_40400 [Stigonema ocellatum SAG 48.90 = DSM 106950]|nr:hypothetical protein [Stigonema ocellatum SAG 48.90 = DSM 106950]
MGMKMEPPRRQERQELGFSVDTENKIIPQICNAYCYTNFSAKAHPHLYPKRLPMKSESTCPGIKLESFDSASDSVDTDAAVCCRILPLPPSSTTVGADNG